MTEESIDALARKVERLERGQLFWRRIGMAGIASCFAVLLMGQSAPTKVIEAEEFIVKKDGKSYGKFGMTAKHGAELSISDSADVRRISIRVEKQLATKDEPEMEEPTIELYGTERGTAAAYLRVNHDHGELLFYAHDEAHKVFRSVVSLHSAPSPYLRLSDKSGKVLAELK